MTKRGLLLGLLAGLIGGPWASGAADPGGPRLALVIGNSAYPSLPALPGCTASAHIVSAALRHAGFEVTERTDVSNGELGAAVGTFASALGAAADSSGVAYVCGYVVDLEGRDFVLPASATLDRDSDVLTQGLVAKSLLNAVVRSGTRAGLLLLDAIASPRSGTALRLETLAQPPLRTVGFAAAVSTGPPPDGATPFAAAISAALAPPQIEVGSVLRSVGARLGNSTGPALTLAAPSEPAWLLGGPSGAAPPPTPTAAAPPAPKVETAVPVAAVPDEEHMTEADRQRIQGALLRLGYYDGRIDGVFGPETRAAIRRFQHEIGAAMVGRITPEQSSRLLDPRAAAATR